MAIFAFNSCVLAETLRGRIEETDEYKQIQDELFTGKVETLNQKNIINMSVTQVIDSSFSMEGDEFFAQVSSDVYGEKGIIIPKGSIAHGRITQELQKLAPATYIDKVKVVAPNERKYVILRH